MWCVAELGLDHERIDAGLEFGKNHEPWFLAMNPNGKVPLVRAGAVTLWESNTIVRLSVREVRRGRFASSIFRFP
jgi:glutathione S-transferase